MPDALAHARTIAFMARGKAIIRQRAEAFVAERLPDDADAHDRQRIIDACVKDGIEHLSAEEILMLGAVVMPE